MGTTMQSTASARSSMTIDSSANLLPAYIPNSTSTPTSSATPKPLRKKIVSALRSSKTNAREEQRAKRDQDDKSAHERRKAIRLGMLRAKETGTPQLVGWDGDRDRDGEGVVEIYVLPPEDEVVKGREEEMRKILGMGNGKKRFVKYEAYSKLVGGGNQGEFNQAMGMAGMGMAIGF